MRALRSVAVSPSLNVVVDFATEGTTVVATDREDGMVIDRLSTGTVTDRFDFYAICDAMVTRMETV
jgi:hypothetical protein